jgi:hypothetical protein
MATYREDCLDVSKAGVSSESRREGESERGRGNALLFQL